MSNQRPLLGIERLLLLVHSHGFDIYLSRVQDMSQRVCAVTKVAF